MPSVPGPRPVKTRARGFTLSELLLVIVIIGLITLIAYPAMKSFSGRNDDAGAATWLAQLVNKTRDQAQRQNRAYLIDFPIFLAGEPGGRMDIFESTSNSCTVTAGALDNEDALDLIEAVPFGRTDIEQYFGPREELVGLSEWALGAATSRERLRLCFSPSGAASRIAGQAAEPIGGDLELRVQRFEGGDNGPFTPVGPPRRVQITFAGGARMRVN
ncbi:MAG: prepilin-type N-terminal cleavage/methylation domain-containing protein [Myxococcales bacterium]|nr:prepilin-type N-terminal cleavage/methylation domain-containing protein [Myxococcales bacterium]